MRLINSLLLCILAILITNQVNASASSDARAAACPNGGSVQGFYPYDLCSTYAGSYSCISYTDESGALSAIVMKSCYCGESDTCPIEPDPDPDPDPDPPNCGDDLVDPSTGQCCPADASQACYDPGNGGPGGGDPGTGDPGTGDPGTGDPGTGDPGTGDPGTGDPGTGDPGTGDPGTGDPGTGDPGTGDPGTGDPGTGDPGTGGQGPSGSYSGTCDSYASCYSDALSSSGCNEQRDIFYFTYISAGDYFYECSECSGGSSSSYQECIKCPFGINSSTGLCYPVTCPFGDCSQPDVNNQQPDKDSPDNSDVVSAIRDLQADLNSGVKVKNLSEVTDKLDSMTSELVTEISKIDSELSDQTTQIVDAINKVTQAINDKEISGGGGSPDTPGTTPDTNEVCRGDNPPDFCTPCEPDEVNGQYPAGCSDTELKDLLKKLLAVQEEAACLLGSADPELCPPEDDDDPEFSHEAEALKLYGAFQSTEWGGLLNSLETAAAGVSGQCTLNFSIFVPYANKEMTVDICMWLEPIGNTLRMFSIAIWGFLGLRHIFSA